jgi:hypothetical protein
MRIAAVGVSILLALAASAARAEDAPGNAQPQVIQLPASVISTFERLPKLSPPPAPLRGMTVANTATGVKSLVQFSPEQSGLWGTTYGLLRPDGAVGMVRSMLGFHGLIMLALTVEMPMRSDMPITTMVPLGKIFAFDTIHVTSEHRLTATRNTAEVSGDLATIAAPSPQATFSYSLKFDTQVTTTGLFGQTRKANHQSTASCNVGDALPASTLNPTLRGNYLPVSCKTVIDGNDAVTSHHAYIVDSGLYLTIDAIYANGSKEAYSILSADYGS